MSPHPLTGLEPLPSMRYRGRVLIARDLPNPGFRWSSSKKKLFVEAVEHRLLTAGVFCKKYGVPPAEFALWRGQVLPAESPPPMPVEGEPVVVLGILRVDLIKHTTSVDNAPAKLTPRVQELLEFFVRNVGRVIPRRELFEYFYGAEGSRTSKGLDVHIHKLREALGPAGAYLKSIWGLGFKFEVSEPALSAAE